MKLTISVFVVAVCLCSMGCSTDKSKSDSLPVIDLSREYPVEKKDIHEIADVEYIPLETTDASVLSGGWTSTSDDYIVIKDNDICFFDRKTGKYLWKFNRMGNSGEEYPLVSYLAVDFESEECYIYTPIGNKVYVYTYHGDFKRVFTLEVGKEFRLSIINDYNQDFLIGYNGFSYRKDPTLLDPHPYYLVSKKDGKVFPLPLTVRNPINKKQKSSRDDGYIDSSIMINEMINLLINEDEAFIGDFALDTLYTTQDCKLTPIAVQSPSVFSGDIPLVLSADLFTDTYMGFYAIKLDADNPLKSITEAPYLYWNRKTGEVHRYELYDSNVLIEKVRNPWMYNTKLDRNYGFYRFKAEFLVEHYEAGNLQGELKEIASKMDMEDNYVLVLCKFK
ncbi:6-bladed beta-propeller [Bacteroides fluxus]|jgi:hypothetical protein